MTSATESGNLPQMKLLPALAAFSLVACATTEKPRDYYTEPAPLMSNCELLWILLVAWWSDT